MKNVIIVIVIAVVLIGGIYWYMESTNNNPREATGTNDNQPAESSATLETGTYHVDEEESEVTWQAGKPAIAGYTHTGKFSLTADNTFTVTNSTITGNVVIDINSLEVLTLGGGKAGQESALEGHLKSERFFDASAYPTATFKVIDVTPHTLPGPEQSDYTATGDLTIKGKTETITFPIKVIASSPTEAHLTGAFTIDRTKWGINYGSASVADKITDQIIGDDVKMNISVKLTK